MKPEDKEELINIVNKSKKLTGIFAILFTLLTIFCKSEDFKKVFIVTLTIYSIYVFIRVLDKKLSSKKNL